MPRPTPSLENLPSAILRRTAYHTSSCNLEPPSDILALMLTSSSLHAALNLQAAPGLYAKLFRVKFDSACPWRAGLADPSNATELVQRFRMMRRAKLGDLSSDSLREDLWAALWMAIEDAGVNELHFSSVCFFEYATSLARKFLHRDFQSKSEVQALVVCLLCYTATREKLAATPEDTREDLLNLLRPFATSGTLARNSLNSMHLSRSYNSPSAHHERSNNRMPSPGPSLSDEISIYHEAQKALPKAALDTLLPRPITSAIILIFVLKELIPLVIPPHLPETRAQALSANRSGPTLRDFQATIRCRTPLPADIRPGGESQMMGASLKLYRTLPDPEVHMLVHSKWPATAAETTSYLPGMLTGVWEGNYLVSNLEATPCSVDVADFVCRKPMQLAVTEYICYAPNQELSYSPGALLASNLKPSHIQITDEGIEIQSQTYPYQKFVPNENNELGSIREAVDILLIGETLEEHEEAWGGYRFLGKVSDDGCIMLKREPKIFEEELLGTWCFVGYLRYGSAFVGEWRSSPHPDCAHGIFSMRRSNNIC